MKALFVSGDPTAFDSASPTRTRLRAYAERIGTLHYLSPAPRDGREETDGALILHPVHAGKLLRPFALARVARSLVRSESIEVVSAQDPFEHGWAALRAVQGTSAKLHIQVHTDFLSPWFVRAQVFRSMRVPAPFLNTIRRRIADRILPRSAGIRAVSLRVAESIVARYGATVPAPSVIPVAVDPRAPAPVALPEHGFSFAFITVSRLAPEKRIEDLLMALGRFSFRYPGVGLIIVGDGPERVRLERLSRKLGLIDRVLFLGEREDARALMGSAQCFLQASAYEGYGRTLVEAALAKIPIITTDVGIVGEVLKGYEEVLATPPGDPANLAGHMEAIIQNHQLRLSLVMNAEHAVRAHLAAYPDQPRLIAEDLARALGTR